jgi:D-alanyl-lipoteichoic acid acyltransferase DltB (MBOAT superfamily)
MTIISISYFALIALSLIIYYIVPKKAQWIVLLLTSLAFFYFAGTPWTIVYLIAGILITWLATFRINQIRNASDKYNEKQVSVRCRAWLIIALILDLGMLASLKYMNFLLSNASRIYNIFAVNNVSWSVNWPAALGISFYTLQIVGYLLDCYWGVVEVQKNPLRLALFTSFFPQMVSGPISRYGHLQDELERPHKFNFNNVMSGATRIAVGLFKKVILAEGVAYFIPIFQNSNTRIAGIYALIALLLYVVRIFADFAGCMDIVIGTAKCFGITMVENFNSPFTSKTIQEFWQRWHITLGLWLRDYIMYPILRTKTWSKMTKKLKECLLELAEQNGITIRFGQSDTAKNKSSVPDQDKK